MKYLFAFFEKHTHTPARTSTQWHGRAPRHPFHLKGCMGPCVWWAPVLISVVSLMDNAALHPRAHSSKIMFCGQSVPQWYRQPVARSVGDISPYVIHWGFHIIIRFETHMSETKCIDCIV